MEMRNPWKFLLEEECDHHLKHLQVPLFGGPNGIDKTFEMLAVKEKDKKSISKRVVNFGSVCYMFRYSPSSYNAREAQVEIRDETTLNNILCLYYGLQCIFAHGKHDKTFKQGGSLSEFPGDLKITNTAK